MSHRERWLTKKKQELNLLFVDDEIDNLSAFVFNCEEFWNTHTSTSPEEVMKGAYRIEQYDALIVDLVFRYPQDYTPELKIDPTGGMTLLEWVQKIYPQVPVMVLSAYLTDDLRKTIQARFPKVLCKDKPLDFSKAEFREMMQNFIAEYRKKT